MNNDEFGIRVKQARMFAGLSQQELADLTGVEKMTVSKYESGKICPNSTHLIALSKALNVPVDYFFRKIRVSLTAEPRYRMVNPHRKLPKKELDRIVAQTEECLEKRADILDILRINEREADITHLRTSIRKYYFHEDIENLAENVRSAWKLGSDPIENLMSVTENNGFKIVLVNGPEDFEAAVFMDENIGTVICLRRGAPKERQRFSLAHELGHVFINHTDHDPEAEANNFAAALLIPKASIIEDTGVKRNNIEPEELLLLRKKYGVSVPSILARMETLGIITAQVKKDTERRFNASGIGKRSKQEMFDSEEPRMVKLLVMRAVAEGIITSNKGRELLGDAAPAVYGTA
ncbi:MAG TPA: XRE family transcriptional regulator [Methanocorpusculum sp.]|nr:ImmA/IrrE family metallo-endopeptidase [Candidatus Methanocorpusculum equi]MCQ2357384.1 XRE family transcriptional regulator [Methanocorpusculum sp.]HJJ33171.1 XRE family transcriptional regulator [Methanocorpusculum sp.]HJJ44753.1 XRE family transcriptional regulator [Methanocorpusculum sp.]HJJ57880.1 XRE family transcriptional regulator [Methanocorpusculum sp.]